jgi:hypothetical protein
MDAGLQEDVVGVDFSLDALAVLERFPMQILVAVATFERFHVLHPEVVGE